MFRDIGVDGLFIFRHGIDLVLFFEGVGRIKLILDR